MDSSFQISQWKIQKLLQISYASDSNRSIGTYSIKNLQFAKAR